jgi:hypothetical protein
MRIVSRNRCFLLLLIFLCLIAVDNAVAQTVKDKISGTLIAGGSETPLQQQVIRTMSDRWVPPDIDSVQPAVTSGVTCSLRDVLSKVGTNVEKFVDNLNRISATETIQHQAVSKSGKLSYPEIRKVEYLASITPGFGGYLSLQEYRGRYLVQSPDQFVDGIDVEGTLIFALIFHPKYVRDYGMTCEGLGTWRGQPAWQVRFEELPDNVHHAASVSMERKTYYLKLRGRAWILADSYQLVGLETDLVQAVPEIHLRLQHQVIEYSQESLSNTDVVMLLPSSAELYMDFRGHRFYRRHSYTDFQLFSVKLHQEFGVIRE